MFHNIGKKIKALAIFIFYLLAIGGILAGIIVFTNYPARYSIIFFCLPVLGWIGSWFLYGLGEIIDKLCDIEANTRNGSYHATTNTNSNATANARPNINTTTNTNTIKQSPSEPPKTGKCDFCNTKNVTLYVCKINDDLGIRYRDLCQDCIDQNSNSVSLL
jgi:hypothetical protein